MAAPSRIRQLSQRLTLRGSVADASVRERSRKTARTNQSTHTPRDANHLGKLVVENRAIVFWFHMILSLVSFLLLQRFGWPKALGGPMRPQRYPQTFTQNGGYN